MSENRDKQLLLIACAHAPTSVSVHASIYQEQKLPNTSNMQSRMSTVKQHVYNDNIR